MTKKLNVDAIANELRGQSAFFPSYKEEQKPVPVQTPPTNLAPTSLPVPDPESVANKPGDAAPLPERPNGRTFARTPERVGGKRIITRNSFEIYEDQMESLRKLAYHEKLEGKVGSMSHMVRDAIDAYLTKNALPEE